jgi:hypothetical protein
MERISRVSGSMWEARVGGRKQVGVNGKGKGREGRGREVGLI